MKNVKYFKEGEVWRVAGGLKGLLGMRHTYRRNPGRTSGRRRIHSEKWEAIDVESSEPDLTKQEGTLGQMLS